MVRALDVNKVKSDMDKLTYQLSQKDVQPRVREATDRSCMPCA